MGLFSLWAFRFMANRKKDTRKKETGVGLSAEESDELQMILDRLSVQSPEGETLDNYLESLRSLLGGREKMAAALIDRVGRPPTEVGFRAFLAFRNLVESGPYRKVVKQAAYRFSQKGLMVERDEDQPGQVVLIRREVRRPLAHVTFVPDGFWLVSALIPADDQSMPMAVTAIAEGSFDHLSVKVSETSNRLYREYLQKIDSHAGKKPGEVPIRHAARLLFEMLDFHGREVADSDVEAAKRLLRPFHDPEKPPYVYEMMPPVEQPEVRVREVNGARLLERTDIGWLVFTRDELAFYRQKIQELENPLLMVPPEIQKERIEEAFRKAADELCVGRKRELFRRFFEEQAMFARLEAGVEEAMDAWIIARHLATGANASENPVVVDVVIASMQRCWPDDFKQQEQEPGGERMTESGLILP